MKRLVPIIAILLLMLFSACKKEEPGDNGSTSNVRYNSLVFSDTKLSTDIPYGTSTTQGGITQTQKLDIYEPSGDTEAKRPLVILAHGGSFLHGDKEDFADLADFFAKSGYVAVSINYRLLDIDRTETTIKRAVIDATNDLKAAIRYFKKDAATVNTYRIDTSNIFVGGYSAGAFMGLHHGYVTTDSEILAIGGSSLQTYVNDNGGHAGSSGNPGYSTRVKGVINIAGALVNANAVDAGEPMLYSVHGTVDAVVPYKTGDADGTGVTTEGSFLIHEEANAKGLTNHLNTIIGGDHGAFFECNSCSSELRNFIYGNL